MLISVVVTTYNRPMALKRVLQALSKQTDSDFEVIVADDGSRDDTREMIELLKPSLSFPLIHAWQEDKGFRLNASRNNGIKKSSGDYLIFLDGDCVPLPNFVSQHRLLAEKGFMVAGNRCLLRSALTRKIENGEENVFLMNWTKALYYRFLGQINRIAPLIHLSVQASFRYKKQDRWQKLRGCNMAFWKEDLLSVSGFDEFFQGWGFDDSEIAVRLINSGVKLKDGSFATGVLHLYHKEAVMKKEGPSWERLQELIKTKETKPKEGLISS